MIDEAQTVTGWDGFYQAMHTHGRTVSFLCSKNMPTQRLLFLSATLDDQSMVKLLRRFYLSPEKVYIITSPSLRHHLVLSGRPFLSNIMRDRVDRIERWIRSEFPDDMVLIYVSFRYEAEIIARSLTKRGIPTEHYHGGMGSCERELIQKVFHEECLHCIVCTEAFGLGIDNPRVRGVRIEGGARDIGTAVQVSGRVRCVPGEKAKAIFSLCALTLVREFVLIADDVDRVEK